MSCTQTVGSDQSEFDFFLQLKDRRDMHLCCGPIIPVGFGPSVMRIFRTALIVMGSSADYLDRYDPVMLDSSDICLTMCSRHWIQHVDALKIGGKETENAEWDDLAFYIFKVVCLVNAWDGKELSNYLG